MAVRYYSLFNDIKKGGYTIKYTDVNRKYWAYNEIMEAANPHKAASYANAEK